jgi:Kef-type K+ transport system membrane component KefB
MTNSELTDVLLFLLLLVGLAHLLGWLFVKLRQPKVVGEILAGLLMLRAVRHWCARDDPDRWNARSPERALKPRVFGNNILG